MVCDLCLKPIMRRKSHRAGLCELCYEESLLDGIQDDWFLEPEIYFEKAKLTEVEIAVVNALILGVPHRQVIASHPELTPGIYDRIKREAWIKLVPHIQKEKMDA